MLTRPLICGIIVGALAGAAVLAHDATSAAYYGWKWPHDTIPVRLHIVTDTQFPKSLQKPLRDAAKTWEKTGVFKFDYPRPVASCDVEQPMSICVQALPGTIIPCPGAGGCSWTNNPTLPSPDGSWFTTYARVFFNTDTTWAGPVWNQYVFCHELGHDLGLDHNTTGCMSYNTDSKPAPDDINLLQQIYNR